MPSLNQARFIGASIDSVLKQDYENLELIIQDGGSEDETIRILEQLVASDPRLKWESRSDNGPADAIQRAFSKVRGEIIGWLNSDDLFAPGALSNAQRAFNDHPDWIMCYGHGEHIDESGRRINDYPTKPPSIGVDGFNAGCFICQPTVFFKTPLLSLLGSIDQTLKTAFDYDYWIRAFKAVPDRIGFIDRVLARSRLHQDCITQRMRQSVALEGLYLSQKHFGSAQSHWLVTHIEEIQCLHEHDQNAFEKDLAAFLDQVETFIDEDRIRELTGDVLFERVYTQSDNEGG